MGASPVVKKPGEKGKVDYNYRLHCKDCDDAVPNLFEDYASGDIICRGCGCVLQQHMIDMRSEWRTFAADGNGPGDDPSRVGGPSNPLLADGEGDIFLESTMISSSVDGVAGKDLSRVHARATTKGLERNLLKAFQEISSFAERIHLPQKISDRAKAIFKKVEDDKLCRGKTSESVIAACLYIACRQEPESARTFREISTLTLVPKKDIGRCYRAISQIFLPSGEKLPASETLSQGEAIFSSQGSHGSSGMAKVSVQDFMARFCSHLNLNMEIQRASVLLCQKVSDLTCVAGKSPISVAAAVIYMITQLYPQHRKAAKDISFVAGVSETTIKNTYKELYPYRFDIITSEIAPKHMIDSLSV